MVDIEWEDPPAVALARVKTPGKYVEWAYALREHPGRWAKLPDVDGDRSEKGAQNLAQNIRRGATAGFTPKGTYEAVADAGVVWVRYTPPADSGEDQTGEPQHDTTAVRAWAREQGFNVTDRGRIGKDVMDAYRQAHPPQKGLRSVSRES